MLITPRHNIRHHRCLVDRLLHDVVSIRMLSIVIGYVEVILSYVIICHQARIIAFLVEKTCEEKLQNSSVFGVKSDKKYIYELYKRFIVFNTHTHKHILKRKLHML